MKAACMSLDAKDRQLLALLAQNSATPLKILAEQCHMSEATCSRRIARLEKSKTIQKYVAVVDEAALGRGLTVFVLLELGTDNASAKQHFIRRLRGLPEVAMLHLVTGSVDYVVEMRLDSMETYQALSAQYFEQEPLVKKYTTLVSLKGY